MGYVVSRLEGAAALQINLYIKDAHISLADVEKVFDILKRAYGDPNPKQTARTKLHQLKQTNKDFEAFLGEFQRLAAKSETPEVQLRDILLDNMSREIKNRVALIVPIPSDFHDLVNLVQQLDYQARSMGSPNDSHPRTNIHGGSNAPRAVSHVAVPVPRVSVTATVPSTASGTHPGPMDVSGAIRRVSQEERDRRHRLGLCHYCGDDGHLAFKCPKKIRRLQVAEVQVPSELGVSSVRDFDAPSQASHSGNV